jgi:NADH:ubiquinone oxidoreductase subunit 6 (subunit J)
MSTSTYTPRRPATVRISAQRDRVARALLIVVAVGAAIATVGAIGTASDADAATRVVETWRLLGLGVFTGLFVLLAYRPRYYAGVWELAIANKFALAAFGIAYGANTTDAHQILAFDGAIAILLLAAYALSRGWRAWSSVRRPGSSAAL